MTESEWLACTDTTQAVAALLAEVATIQAHVQAVIHRTPQPRFSPAGAA
jgi:hypothetical protein